MYYGYSLEEKWNVMNEVILNEKRKESCCKWNNFITIDDFIPVNMSVEVINVVFKLVWKIEMEGSAKHFSGSKYELVALIDEFVKNTSIGSDFILLGKNSGKLGAINISYDFCIDNDIFLVEQILEEEKELTLVSRTVDKGLYIRKDKVEYIICTW